MNRRERRKERFAKNEHREQSGKNPGVSKLKRLLSETLNRKQQARKVGHLGGE